MTTWRRPVGPPVVWRVIDGYELQDDGTKKPIKISVQEVPHDKARKEEVIELMCGDYLADEPMAIALAMTRLPEIEISTYRKVLDNNVSIGCYKLNSEGHIEQLIGINLLYVTRETIANARENEEKMEEPDLKKVIKVWRMLLEKSNILEELGIDEFLKSCGLYVPRRYRGQKLGQIMLEVRSDMAKKYGLKQTMTLFSGSSSQKQAQRAGYEEICAIEYKDLVDDAGHFMFPGIDTPSAKLMIKYFS